MTGILAALLSGPGNLAYPSTWDKIPNTLCGLSPFSPPETAVR